MRVDRFGMVDPPSREFRAAMCRSPIGKDLGVIASCLDRGRPRTAVSFLVDPLTWMPHNPDIGVLMRACNVHDLPLATNRAAADLIMTGFGVLSLQ